VRHVCLPLSIRALGQRSPPPARVPKRSHWRQLPSANRQRLLQLLGRLVERRLSHEANELPASTEEVEHDLQR
jgi:hypothetical protein